MEWSDEMGQLIFGHFDDYPLQIHVYTHLMEWSDETGQLIFGHFDDYPLQINDNIPNKFFTLQ